MNTIEVIFITSSALALITGLLILAINPWRTINQAYMIAASLSSVWLLSVFMSINAGLKGEQHVVLFWLKIGNSFSTLLPWTYALVKIAITEPGSLVRAIKRSWLWFLAGFLLIPLIYSDNYFFAPSGLTSEQQKRGFAYTIHVSSLAVLCLLVLIDGCRKMRECTGARLLEIKFFVINICLSTLIILASLAVGTLFDIASLRYISPFVIVASFGLTLWAICYHRVFDARQVFATLGRRISTLIVLAGFILIVHPQLSRSLSEPLSLLISACCGGVLAAYWDRLACRWLELDSTRILAAPRAQIIEWAREEADTEKLAAKFESFLRDWCQTTTVSLHTVESNEPPNRFLRTSDYTREFPKLRQTGYLTKETLERRRPDPEAHAANAVLTDRNLGALIAVPRGSHSPSCLVAFGHKQSLRPYTHPDLQVLIALVETMDNILTHSRVAARTAQIEKMESAAMMSRGLAHDLNNLATPVSTFLLHMESRVTPGTAEAEVLADAKHSIRVMQDYIRESLFFARRLVPDFQPLSMTDLLTSTVKVTQARAQARGVTVVIESPAELPFRADRALIQRLLQNLVFNGIDATPRGGRVTLSGAASDHECVAFRVTDGGSGVPPEIIDRIFEPYFTTKDTGDEVRGLGLGLAISLKISDLHGGALKVGRSPSGGAVFSVILPQNPGHPSKAFPSVVASTPTATVTASVSAARSAPAR